MCGWCSSRCNLPVCFRVDEAALWQSKLLNMCKVSWYHSVKICRKHIIYGISRAPDIELIALSVWAADGQGKGSIDAVDKRFPQSMEIVCRFSPKQDALNAFCSRAHPRTSIYIYIYIASSLFVFLGRIFESQEMRMYLKERLLWISKSLFSLWARNNAGDHYRDDEIAAC